ncbi:FAH family protein [Sphingomonas psychrotolerans]|uniref:FAH family protein n=1 Tax=Sphingomonas psychrotolerans TaxID=1327635 RepID=A0ABU3N208_9SPHN|nr:AraD1 family protein [Sphingomonas psychrotolerans]MDT8758562.1 FAH family protein [Sphingomonas psychrotolerans]
MTFRLVQFRDTTGERGVAAFLGDEGATRLNGVTSTYALALAALAEGVSLEAAARERAGGSVDLAAAEAEGRLLAPIDHPDAAHCYVTGTGLTHLGSAEGRDQMHKAAAGGTLTDSMRMFNMGLEGGKPTDGKPGVQPEWFYKGDGSSLVGPGEALPSPDFALDGSEEPEIAGIYIIDEEGRPRRLGFALGNEFSDHVTERGNYLWLAHSKLRHASLGAELLVGALPADVRGTSKIVRNGETIWEKPFLSGEANMSHAIANLEHHHFKYGLFRRPGDLHVHFFGTATLSFADGVKTEEGDVFEVSAAPFTLPLRNPLKTVPAGDASVLPL